MKFRYIILPAIAAVMPAGIFAQDLHKEITVEQEIVPARRDASRIMVHPAVTLPPLKASSLTFSDRTVTTDVPNSITILDPVAWGDKLYYSPYRGYVDLGVGTPIYDGVLSAGYRILDNDRTRLSIWGQYDGDIYKRGRNGSGERLKWNDQTATVGIDLHYAAGKNSFVDAGVDYTYSSHKVMSEWKQYTSPANRFNMNATYRSAAGALNYEAALKFRRFAFGEAKDAVEFVYSYTSDLPSTLLRSSQFWPNVSENLFGLNAKGNIASSDHSIVGIDLDASFLNTSDHYRLVSPLGLYDYVSLSGKTTGLVTITPYWSSHSDKTTLRIGADVDVAVNSGNAFRFSPDVTFAWTPMQIFGIELKAHGGSRLNTLSGLYDITPYLNSSSAYTDLSRIPYAFDGKITMGPLFGAYIEIYGGYAKADKWLMASSGEYVPGGASMYAVDLKGWHFGLTGGYDNGKNLSLKASWETAPSKYDKAYYEWRDRARHVVKTQLMIRPIEKLNVELSYEFRTGRCEYAYSQDPIYILGIPYYEPVRRNLGAISDLALGAGYEFTERLTFFARGANLLNRDWSYLGGVPVQGLHIMIGAGFKF